MILGPGIRLYKSICWATSPGGLEFLRPGTKLFKSEHEAFPSPGAKLDEARYKAFSDQVYCKALFLYRLKSFETKCP